MILTICHLPGIWPRRSFSRTYRPTGINLAKLAVRYSDGVIKAATGINADLEKFIAKNKVPMISSPAISTEDTSYIEAYNTFYDQILG